MHFKQGTDQDEVEAKIQAIQARKGPEISRGLFAAVYPLSGSASVLKEQELGDANDSPETLAVEKAAIRREFTITKKAYPGEEVDLVIDDRSRKAFLILPNKGDVDLQNWILKLEAAPSEAADLGLAIGNYGPELIHQVAYKSLKCLHNLHLQGVCHGDIKPDNIMVQSAVKGAQIDGEEDFALHLIDFGLSAATKDAGKISWGEKLKPVMDRIHSRREHTPKCHALGRELSPYTDIYQWAFMISHLDGGVLGRIDETFQMCLDAILNLQDREECPSVEEVLEFLEEEIMWYYEENNGEGEAYYDYDEVDSGGEAEVYQNDAQNVQEAQNNTQEHALADDIVARDTGGAVIDGVCSCKSDMTDLRTDPMLRTQVPEARKSHGSSSQMLVTMLENIKPKSNIILLNFKMIKFKLIWE